MLGLLHTHPRARLADDGDLFGDAADLFALAGLRRRALTDLWLEAPGAPLAKRRRQLIGQAAPLGPLRLQAEEGRFVATLPAPGVRAADLSVELLGNRVLQVRATTHTARPDSDATHAGSALPPSAGDAGSQQREAAARSTVVMERSVALPQLVDSAGIAATYRDGLLRVEIPIQPPAAGDEQRARMAALEQEAKDADARVEELCKQLPELRAKARDAHQAVRTEKAEAQRALQTSRHTLAIEAGA